MSASERRRLGAREVAAVVLGRVEKDAAFAAAALDAELARHVQLDDRDRSFVTELVYGTLRVRPWLEAEIARFVPRGIDSLDRAVLVELTLAAYQLYFTRVPAFAAVHSAVDAVRRARGDRLSGFANAVLRRVSERAAVADEGRREAAIVASTPAWLSERLTASLSAEDARAFLRSGAEPPPLALRVEQPSSRGEWIEKLRSTNEAATFEAGAASPRAILARGTGKPQRLPGWEEGAWAVQEEGAQLAALALAARPGEVVLDACAGRGNKTAVLARAVGPSGAVDACDISEAKLGRLGGELARLGLSARSTFAVDWTVGSGQVSGRYDRVLVDAPCTGVGTLRRRPEIALRRLPADLSALARSQAAIVIRAAEHLRSGGALVYVVCSVLREEGEEVLEEVRRARPELAPAPFESPEVHALFGDPITSFRLLSHRHGTDGYFIAHLRSR